MKSILKLNSSFLISLLFCYFVFPGCKKLVEVDPPVTSTTGASVYTQDATAIAALTNIYAAMAQGKPTTGNLGVSLLAGLSADELTLFSGISPSDVKTYYYTNTLYANGINSFGSEWWSIYNRIFVCNSAIEGLNAATTVTPAIKQQLLGEAKFLRAFFYFYLVNFYGDVPLVTGTDYKINSLLPRTPKVEVYQQILQDLNDAKQLLSTDYLDGTLLTKVAQRLRPTNWAATALLARVYLYNQKWDSAEAQATLIINNSTLFHLDTLNGVFLTSSAEAIWQLQPVNLGWNTEDARVFIIPSSGPGATYPVYLSENLLNSFEAGDQRRLKWVDSVIKPAGTFYFPYKYKSATLNKPVTEYLMALRLGEQYLIRAEARAEQNNVLGAGSDLNMIRNRAGLNSIVLNDKASLLSGILHERQVELFAEWGHRWLDIKRTGSVDSVMSVVCQNNKGATWHSYQQLYPIPFADIQEDPNLVQNVGY